MGISYYFGYSFKIKIVNSFVTTLIEVNADIANKTVDL